VRGRSWIICSSLSGARLLRQGAPCNEPWHHPTPALVPPSSNDRYLLDRGARIDDMDSYGGTAVYEASFWGRCGAVRLLLERGADPTRVRQDTRRSPLMAAVSSCQGSVGIMMPSRLFRSRHVSERSLHVNHIPSGSVVMPSYIGLRRDQTIVSHAASGHGMRTHGA
jgi:hypothetical protein